MARFPAFRIGERSAPPGGVEFEVVVPVYAWQGLSADGRRLSGSLEAEGARAARARLRRDGVFPTALREDTAAAGGGEGLIDRLFGESRNARLRPAELALVSRQLATLMAAGVPAVEALDAVAEQAERPAERRILQAVREDVVGGSALADALARHPASFPVLYSGMVRAGEAAGALDLVLGRLASWTETQSQLASKLRNALAYPILMLVASLGIVGFLLAFVVPKVTRIFEDQRQALPLPTRLLLGVSNLLLDNLGVVLFLAAATVAGALVALRRPPIRLKLDRMLLRAPVIGPLVTRVAVARFARTLATLLAGGLPLLEALPIAGEVSGNGAMADAVRQAALAVREGRALAPTLRELGLFPPLLVHMVRVGERSGEIEGMLERVSDAYEGEVEGALATLTAVLEPALILVMGGIVLFIVLAILLPIFEINSLVK